MKKIALIISFVLGCLAAYAQKTTEEWIAEYEQNLASATSDTSRVIYNQLLAITYRRIDMKKAKEAGFRSLRYAIGTGSSFYIATALNTVAYTYMVLGELDKAQVYSEKSLNMVKADTLNYEKNDGRINHLLGKIYNTLGSIYDYKGEHSDALAYFFKAERLYHKINLTKGLATTNNNIGISYLYMGDLEKAESYFLKSFDNYIAINDSSQAYQIKMNLGVAISGLGRIDEALSIYWEVYHAMKKIGNLRDVGHSITNIGDVYRAKGELDSAKICVQEGIEIDKQLADKEGLALNYRVMGEILYAQNDFNGARKHFRFSLDLAEDLNSNMVRMDSYGKLYQLEEELGNFKKALEYHQLYSAYADSIQLENNSRALGRVEAENEFNKQLAIQKAEDEQKLKIQEEKRKKETTKLYFSVGIMAFIIVFVIIVLRNLRETRKQKDLVQKAKLEIEEKNNELLDSIRYAQRIQEALLQDETIQSNIPNHFIYFRPKDIVSGDFYWSYVQDEYWYLAVADCTGHGVPGAMLTMLGTAYLNEICAEENALSPAKILDELKRKVTTELSQTGLQGETKDGMDISMLRMNLSNGKVDWAGANNGLYVVNSGGVKEYKPNKQPIGYSSKVEPFTHHEIEIQKGDLLYLFSDGFPDQFGGEKGKKFKYSNFKALLLQLYSLEVEHQKNRLDETLVEWMGDFDQLDDICVIGVLV